MSTAQPESASKELAVPAFDQLTQALAGTGILEKTGMTTEELFAKVAEQLLNQHSSSLKNVHASPKEEIKQTIKTVDTVVAAGDFSNFDNFVCAYMLHLIYGEQLVLQPYLGLKQNLPDQDGLPVRAATVYHIGNIGEMSPKHFSNSIAVAGATGPDFASINFFSMRSDNYVNCYDAASDSTFFARRVMVAQPEGVGQPNKTYQLLQQALHYAGTLTWQLGVMPSSLPSPVTINEDGDPRKSNFVKLLISLDQASGHFGQEQSEPAAKLLDIVSKIELSFEAWDRLFSDFTKLGLA